MSYTRRDFGRVAMSLAPVVAALSLPEFAVATPDSKITGVQIGLITYSLRQGIAKPDLPSVMAKIGISSVELMSGDAEAMAGAPVVPAGRGGGGGGRAPLTPEQVAAQAEARKALTNWRTSATPATFQAVRKQFNDAGVQLQILCYNM